MRFASLGGSGNFAQAGVAAGREGAKIFKAVRDNSPDFGSLAVKQKELQSKKNVAQIDATAIKDQAEIKSDARVSIAKEDIKQDNIIKGSRRKAGVVAAMGKVGLGAAEAFMGKPEKRDFSSFDEKIEKLRSGATDLRNQSDAISTDFKPAASPPASSSTKPSTTDSSTSTSGSMLTGARKELADAIAGPESGSWGYEAFNQGGAEGGTKVLGKSGSHKDTFGTSLTDLSLGEIFHRQNTKSRGLSMDEHFSSGVLHAVGRYQFIGSTLQDEVSKMGLSLDTKFTPEVQDQIFFSHIKRVGNISPWIGPSANYGPGKKDHLNSLIPQL